MNNAYLLLGSNQGDRTGWLQQAMNMLAEKCGTIAQKSSVYETAAWGITDQPAFLNMVIHLQTVLSPTELLTQIQQIETTLGRQRDIKWGQRTLDIDILLYNDAVVDLPELVIPHPYMQERRFTLAPLAEIAPHYMHPKLNKTITELLAACPDTLEVHKTH
ncbi:MAG: 2-amino-4-hydroxy-6-hydroxymethyldihydropteridine pyrophosphokinae [Flavipsychrobacter sp.]|jgi:2-amino-4-hydroxy-6-hydroxymethyldihydropteridine diphosphokinase|nr:2-amino-4-hydroxy-6-hydroxymethyldihydropteridine pyrophosphokinae [Flavipsychrobacter sp.]